MKLTRKHLVVGLWAAGALVCVNLALAADIAPADRLKAKLLAVGKSPRYYWAWTRPWVSHAGWYGDAYEGKRL